MAGFGLRSVRGVGLGLILVLMACDGGQEAAEDRYAAGLAFLESGDEGKALIEFRAALKLDDRLAPVHYQSGLLQERRGKLERAFAHFRRAAELAPELIDVRLKVAEYFMLAEDVAGAKVELTAVLEREPEHAQALALAAAAELLEGRRDEARVYLDRALAVDSELLRARTVEIGYLLAEGETARALGRTDAALELWPEAFELHRLRLDVLHRLGKEEGVAAQFTAMIGMFPERMELREAHAAWALKAGDSALAEAELRALTDAEPERLAAFVRFLSRERGAEAARGELLRRLATAPDRPRLEMMLAELDFEVGDSEAAKRRLAALAEGGTEAAVGARVRLARRHFEEGDWVAGDAAIAAALETDPGNVEALRLRIVRLIEVEAYDDAIQAARAGLSEAPDDVALLILEARVQELSGNLDLANDRFASAVRSSKYGQRAVMRYVGFLRRTGRTSGAESVLTEAVARAPRDEVLVEQLAVARLALEDWLGAEEALAQLATERARELRAVALIGQERFDESEQLIRGGAAARDLAVTALYRGYIRAGETEKAVAFLDDLIAETPDHLQALGLRGNLHAQAGERAAAEALYQRILDADPNNPGAHVALARLVAAEGDLQAAERLIREGLERAPNLAMLLVQLAEYRQRAGDPEEAINIYERAYALAPDSLLVANNLASLLAEHQTDEASHQRAYRIATRLRGSRNPAHQDTYGWTRHLAGEHEEALAAIAPVAAVQPENPWVRYHIGAVLSALGRTEEARPHLEAALALTKSQGVALRPAIEAALAQL